MIKKKTVLLLLLLSMIFASCSRIGKVLNENQKVIDIGEKYPGYYASIEDGRLHVTNYDGRDISNLPKYQELIKFGEDPINKSEGVVYSLLILDQENSKFYSAELDKDTYKILVEKGEYFSTVDDKEECIKKLLGIINYAKEKSE